MDDKLKGERIWLLLKMWFYFKENNLFWPAVTEEIERRLNEELPEPEKGAER